MADRRRTDVAAGRVVNFLPREKGFMPPFDAVTSVSVVPFTDDGRLVAVLLDRGIDLPGGHVQEGEQTVEEVARREAYVRRRASHCETSMLPLSSNRTTTAARRRS